MKRQGGVARVVKMKIACNILFKNLQYEAREWMCTDDRIIQTSILKEKCVDMYKGFCWLGTG